MSYIQTINIKIPPNIYSNVGGWVRQNTTVVGSYFL